MSNTNTDALTDYIQDFYNNPAKVEDYKINFLKNHYFPTINAILKCSFEEFKIGMSKHNNIIWFCNINTPNYQVMYDFKNDLYYINEKEAKPYSINIENYINKKDEITNEESKKRKRYKNDEINEKIDLYNTCLMPCNIA